MFYDNATYLEEVFKGTGIFDLKRTQIYTHTFA
jgi:hypothetical protein